MNQTVKPLVQLTPEAVRAIEDILKRRNRVEVKIENGAIAVIEIQRKKKY